MPNHEEIQQQRDLLRVHRATLHQYLMQQGKLGTAYTPPNVVQGIQESRAHIQQCKARLRNWGISIEDLPDDEEAGVELTAVSPAVQEPKLHRSSLPPDVLQFLPHLANRTAQKMPFATCCAVSIVH